MGVSNERQVSVVANTVPDQSKWIRVWLISNNFSTRWASAWWKKFTAQYTEEMLVWVVGMAKVHHTTL